jgi:hypothetical protein
MPLSTTDTTWLGPGWNPGHSGWKSATNSLSYGTAFKICDPWDSNLSVVQPEGSRYID